MKPINDNSFYTSSFLTPRQIAYRDPRWLKIRNEAWERDQYTCRACGRTNVDLCGHHILYKDRYGLAPWETSVDNIVCLCQDCHHEFRDADWAREKSWNPTKEERASTLNAFIEMKKGRKGNYLLDLFIKKGADDAKQPSPVETTSSTPNPLKMNDVAAQTSDKISKTQTNEAKKQDHPGYKRRFIPKSFKKKNIKTEVFDETASTFENLEKHKICISSVLRVAAGIAHLLEKEILNAASETDVERIVYSHFIN
jgi:5-methylcytosine-specific restriction endonuclease McrA